MFLTDICATGLSSSVDSLAGTVTTARNLHMLLASSLSSVDYFLFWKDSKHTNGNICCSSGSADVRVAANTQGQKSGNSRSFCTGPPNTPGRPQVGSSTSAMQYQHRHLSGSPWPHASVWRCKSTNPHLFLWRLRVMQQCKQKLWPQTCRVQLCPRSILKKNSLHSPFPEGKDKAWERQVLLPLTRLSMLQKIKAQPLGFRNGMQQESQFQRWPKSWWERIQPK